MKTAKQFLALILSLCMLIGMPMAVSAADGADEFRITKAVEVSYNVMDWDNVTWSGSVNGTNFWNQDKYKGRMIAVYFNQDIPEDADALFKDGHLGGKICVYSGETLKDTMTAFYLGINTVEDALLFGIGTQITDATPYGRTFDIMRSDNTSKFGAAHAKGATSFKLFLYYSCDGHPRNSILKCFNSLTDGTGSSDHITINEKAVDTVECEIVQDVLKVDKMVALPDRMAVNPEKNSTLLVVFNQNVQNLVAGKTIDTTKHEFKYCVLVKDKASGSVIRSEEYGSLVPDEGFSKGNVLGFKMQNAARFFDFYETTWLSGQAAYSEVVGYEVLIYDKEKPNTTYVDYIVSSETGKELFTDQPSATVDLYRTHFMRLSSTVELPLTNVELHGFYQATMTFSQPVTINDVSKILLVDGDKTFAGKEIVSGNGTTAVTVAFDSGSEMDALSDGAYIRITDSVENFMLDTLTVIGSDALLMHDETKQITVTANNSVGKVAVWDNKAYETVEDAFVAANTAGTGTVTLRSDAKAEELVVAAGVTLDLNGFELTAETVLSYGNVIDLKNGQGGIKIAKNEEDVNLILTASNGMLPLYDEDFEGYRFFNCTLEHKGRVKDGDYQFGYIMKMSDAAFSLLVDNDADIALEYDITIQVDDKDPVTLLRKFKAEIMEEYAEKQLLEDDNTYAAVLRVTGFDQVTTQTVTLTSTNAHVLSGTGVVIAAANPVSYTYSNAQ